MDQSAPPDDLLCKEVYAHFGIAIYLTQCIESGMINILSVLSAAQDKKNWLRTFDSHHEKRQDDTFGALVKLLEKYNKIPANIMSQLKATTDIRNFLCHGFWFENHPLCLQEEAA